MNENGEIFVNILINLIIIALSHIILVYYIVGLHYFFGTRYFVDNALGADAQRAAWRNGGSNPATFFMRQFIRSIG